MSTKLPPIEKIPLTPEGRIDLSQPRKGVDRAAAIQTFAHSQSVPVAPAQRREVPAAYLPLEPRPLSAYDDNPVLNEAGAAFIVGVTADCLKKWRQRKQGPDYIQYGPNGPVRYELKALMEFRDRYKVTYRNRN